MTRNEHLKFCKKCQNRKFDPQRGLICNLTDQIADFEGECKDFIHDETVKEEAIPEDINDIEIIAELPEDIKGKLRLHQDLLYAFVGGLFLSILSALLWALITVATEYQIGYMAIGVGFIVGMGVRFFGAGIDPIYGYIGAFFSLLGCLLGNLFSQIGFAAEAQSLGYFEILSFIDFNTILIIFEDTFNVIDVLFYGIAIFEGYKFAFRPISTDLINQENFTPEYSNLRMPIAVIAFLIISFIGYNLSRGVNGLKTFYYESGAVMSSGEYQSGKESGIWNYYYENGKPQAKIEYKNGIDHGSWEMYYDNGNLQREGIYQNGLVEGTWLNYDINGELSDSSNYLHGRLNGTSKAYYGNNQIIHTGKFVRDRQDGFWITYFENGQKNTEGNYKKGEPIGNWKVWSAEGLPIQEIEYVDPDNFKIINAWDQNGNPTVTNGNGEYKDYHENGQLIIAGIVKNGEKVGIWKSFHSNGKRKEEIKYDKGILHVLNTWSDSGEEQVVHGEGNYITFFEDSTNPSEKGLIKNGFREGYWETYYFNSIIIQQESNYKAGKFDGRSVNYYLTGNIYVEGNFKDGNRDGEWIWHHESGLIECSVNYIDNKKEGTQIFWNESGLQTKEELYENDELISEKLLLAQ
jgi:antitoxin component YwqK of YwqJK toxin-antitoxin module